ncbi:hypothetical protein C8Q77DRAFT_663228 [Trametes polyzona]|nr:hypothetical protein C8Q77DRAFT_663228 [Trametes polyzona]
MALALPTPCSYARDMPVRSSSFKASVPDRRLVISTTLPSPTEHHDAPYRLSPASPEESDEPPLSPMIFQPNEEYEKNRLSFYAPPPRAASSPSSPNDEDEISPVLFSHPNVSSPTLVLPPLPAFPSTNSLAARIKRPLPPLPKVVTVNDGGASQTASRHELPAFPWREGRISPFGSDIDDLDTDSLTAFSMSSSPSSTLQSPVTSVYTTASSGPPDSARITDNFSGAELKARPLALTIPSRSHSAPLPTLKMVAPFADRFASPYISVTPASPVPPKHFPFHPSGKKRTRTASATSIVLPSDSEDDPQSRSQLPTRSTSPAPSLTPSVSSTKSVHKPKSTLRRIASKTKLFGRRKLSTSSDPWGHEEEETVVGHGSHSLDEQAMRSRSESPLGLCESARESPDCVPRSMRRVEIAEIIITPQGDLWESRELDEVIPKLRQLRAPTRIKI